MPSTKNRGIGVHFRLRKVPTSPTIARWVPPFKQFSPYGSSFIISISCLIFPFLLQQASSKQLKVNNVAFFSNLSHFARSFFLQPDSQPTFWTLSFSPRIFLPCLLVISGQHIFTSTLRALFYAFQHLFGFWFNYLLYMSPLDLKSIWRLRPPWLVNYPSVIWIQFIDGLTCFIITFFCIHQLSLTSRSLLLFISSVTFGDLLFSPPAYYYIKCVFHMGEHFLF